MRRPLHSLYARLGQHCKSDTFARRQLLKLSFFLEQYNFKLTGFYLLDFAIMDYNFFYNTVVNCIVYFILIAEMLQ